HLFDGVRQLKTAASRFHPFTFVPSRFGMSALPPIADICSAQAHVRFGPKADIADLIQSPRRRATGSTAGQKDRAPWPSLGLPPTRTWSEPVPEDRPAFHL